MLKSITSLIVSVALVTLAIAAPASAASFGCQANPLCDSYVIPVSSGYQAITSEPGNPQFMDMKPLGPTSLSSAQDYGLVTFNGPNGYVAFYSLPNGVSNGLSITADSRTAGSGFTLQPFTGEALQQFIQIPNQNGSSQYELKGTGLDMTYVPLTGSLALKAAKNGPNQRFVPLR